MKEQILNSIKDYRKTAGLTQEGLAKAMGVSRQTIISIEKGKYVPSLPLALRMARFFGRSTDEMFQLDEESQR
jgi:putative transcriptional regulator